MNNSTFFKSFNQLFTLLALATLTFLVSCGGDDEPPTPNCDGLALIATGEGNTISVSATGGTAPYVYSLNGEEQSGTSFTDLAPGTYGVVVTDANECTDLENIVIEDPCVGFTIEASGAGYAVSIEIEKGEGPFSYVISYGDDTEESTSDERSFTVELDEAEATTITITDANGCEQQATLTAEEVRSFTDSRDGQTYQTIKIGNQIWFAENFNYNTNTADSTSSWYYDDDSVAYAAEYGRLYTWYVAQEIAPEGWELASEDDFQDLINYLGVGAGTQLKVGGNSMFEAKLAGARLGNSATYDELSENGIFWTATEADQAERARSYFVTENSGIVATGSGLKNNALSVRVIKY